MTDSKTTEVVVEADSKKRQLSDDLPSCSAKVVKTETDTYDDLPQLIDASWANAGLKDEFKKPYFKKIVERLNADHASVKKVPVFPPKHLIFEAFRSCPFDQFKVLIVGQDPYMFPGQAEGLCFSVPIDVKVPPSLNTVYEELAEDIPGWKRPTHGNLLKWAKQGVLLLNTTLTVMQGKPLSHAGIGWETFTDAVLKLLNDNTDNKVFLLWGAHAQKKGKLIDGTKHRVLPAAHPSPQAGGKFLKCKHFSKTNMYLKMTGQKAIDWSL